MVLNLLELPKLLNQFFKLLQLKLQLRKTLKIHLKVRLSYVLLYCLEWDRSIERQRDIHLADDGLLDDDKPLRKVVEPKKTVKVPSQVFQPTEEDFELVSEDEATREDLARTTKSPHSSFEQPVEETTEKPETEISTSRPGLTAPPPGSPAREAIVNVLADKLGEILGTNKLLGAVTTQAPVTTEAPRPKQIVCPTSLGYYVVAGNELVLPRAPLPGEVHIFEGVGQPKCGQLCSTNRVRLLYFTR